MTKNVPARRLRKSDASSMSAAMDQIANSTPLKSNAVVKIGNVSMTENAKSGKLAIIDEKSENMSEDDLEESRLRKARDQVHVSRYRDPTDAPNTHAEAAIFAPSIRRSRRLMRSNIFSVRPAGGSGVREGGKKFFVVIGS